MDVSPYLQSVSLPNQVLVPFRVVRNSYPPVIPSSAVWEEEQQLNALTHREWAWYLCVMEPGNTCL